MNMLSSTRWNDNRRGRAHVYHMPFHRSPCQGVNSLVGMRYQMWEVVFAAWTHFHHRCCFSIRVLNRHVCNEIVEVTGGNIFSYNRWMSSDDSAISSFTIFCSNAKRATFLRFLKGGTTQTVRHAKDTTGKLVVFASNVSRHTMVSQP